MSSNDFHLHFVSKAQTFDIDFKEQNTASSDTVLINGRNYSLQGDTFKISWLRQKISSLSTSENTTFEDLQSRLKEIGSTDLAVTEKVKVIAKPQLSRSMEINTKSATEAYLLATENPHDSHVAVGILRPDGSLVEFSLGTNEDYGAHRIGSVTKTFTTFLALKLVNDGLITLETSLGDLVDKKLIDESILQSVFADPEKAKQMTLEQLLSHTSGLEYDDRPLGGPKGEDPRVKLPTLHDRFVYERNLQDKIVKAEKHIARLKTQKEHVKRGKAGRAKKSSLTTQIDVHERSLAKFKREKYKHEHQPGEGIGLYSNIGFDVAAWMLEVAYNAGKESPKSSFSQIIKDELFTKVFHLSEKTCISPGPSGNGDVIQAGCGDMVSSIGDLLKVAKALQNGEEHLVSYFGEGWQKKMLDPRGSDGTYTYGLGCEASSSSIQFSGLNCEIFKDKRGERDVTAHIALPLQKGQPGIVVMSDSNALGPEKNQVKFRQELRKLAGL